MDFGGGGRYGGVMFDLSENRYNRRAARHEAKLKLWRSVGFLLTYRCSAACEFCYYACTPQKGGLLVAETCVAAWRSLREMAGDSARVHLTGGEPFLYWDRLVEILSEGQRQGLGPVDLIETNGFWAVREPLVRNRLQTLLGLGVHRLKVSVDSFHQEYIARERPRLLARVAREMFGPQRVLVRWEQYLDDCGLQIADRGWHDDRANAYIETYRAHPFRCTGRAAGPLADLLASAPAAAFARANCRGDFLGAKGIHVDPYGNVFSGTCSAIILGNVGQTPLEEIWRQFDPRRDGLVGTLCEEGPFGLLARAESRGYQRLNAYADKCHLCTHLRQFLFEHGMETQTIGPAACYR